MFIVEWRLRFRRSREFYPAIPIADIPRPLSRQSLIDWDDNEPPPLPPRFDDDLPSLRPGRRPRFSALAVGVVAAVALAGTVFALSSSNLMARRDLADERSHAASSAAAQPELSGRIETAMADLPREDMNTSEQKQALIRSVRPDLVPPETGRLPVAPALAARGADFDDALLPGAGNSPSAPELDKPVEEEVPSAKDWQAETQTPPSETKTPGEMKEKGEGHHASRRDHRGDERASTRALRHARLRQSVRDASASIAPASAPASQSTPFNPFILPQAVRPIEQPPG